jgi:hypothetical protein
MVSKNNGNNNTVLATLALMLLSLSVVSWIAISTPHYASAQGVLEGLEREQSGEGVPGGQSADTGGALPLNDTTTAQRGDVQGSGGNATNATMIGAAGNATTTGDGGTTAGGNQTGGGQ